MKNKSTKLKKITDKIGVNTNLYAFQSFSFEMNSANDIAINGTKEILDYDERGVVVITDDFMIDIKGEKINVDCFSPQLTYINGNIKSIEFTDIKKEKK